MGSGGWIKSRTRLVLIVHVDLTPNLEARPFVAVDVYVKGSGADRAALRTARMATYLTMNTMADSAVAT